MVLKNHWSVLTIYIFVFLRFCTANTTVMESYHVHTNIRYRFASTCITSKIWNTAMLVQGVGFIVALPKEAFISSYLIETGGKTYKGLIRGRMRRSQSYVWLQENIIRRFRDSNKFALLINVSGGASVTFAITYVEMLKRNVGRYEYRVNLIPGQVVNDLVVEVFIQENRKLTLLKVPALRGPQNIVSAYDKEEDNKLVRLDEPSPNSAHVTFAPSNEQQTGSGLAHTFVVQYDVEHSSNGDIIIWNGVFIHFFAADQTALPKDIVFVLDVSRSMWGDKMDQMKEAMMFILENLQEQDKFNIVPFSFGASKWQNGLRPASISCIMEARKYVEKFHAAGETNTGTGIMTARQILYEGRNKSRQAMIFLLTGSSDWSIIPDDTSIPIYGLTFDNDNDYYYLKPLPVRNLTVARRIYKDIDAAKQIINFFRDISSVHLKDVRFLYGQDKVDISSLTKTVFPVIFMGSEAVVSGKLQENVTQLDFEIDAIGAPGQEKLISNETESLYPGPKENETDTMQYSSSHFAFSGLMRQWAYMTIQDKLREEQKRATTQGQYKDLEDILDLSLKHGFGTPLTSMTLRDPVTGSQMKGSVYFEKAEIGEGRRITDFLSARPFITRDTTTATTITTATCTTTTPITTTTTTTSTPTTTTTKTPTTTTTTTNTPTTRTTTTLTATTRTVAPSSLINPTTPTPSTITTSSTPKAPTRSSTTTDPPTTEKKKLPAPVNTILLSTLTVAPLLIILINSIILIIIKVTRKQRQSLRLEGEYKLHNLR